MPKFEYTAQRDGKLTKGVVDSVDRQGAQKLIADQGMSLVSLKEQKKGFRFNIELSEPRVKLQDKVIFTRLLATMINAGIPLVQALATLSAQTESEGLKRHMPEIVKQVESGMQFADVLDNYPKIFDEIYVSMIRAGEEGGILDEILLRLADQQEKDSAVRGKLKSALTYPAVVFTVTIIAVGYLMTSVVPQIGEVILDMAGPDYQLPIHTRILLGISDFFKSYILFIAAGLVLGVFGFRRLLKTEKGRSAWDRLLIKIPVLGPLLIKVSLSRFSRTFSSLSSAGVGVLHALRVTANAAGNEEVKRVILHAAKEVEQGKQLSEPLAKVDFFPPVLAQMIQVGEETGEIDEVLIKLANFYDEEVDRASESMTSIIEPVMIVVLGGIVGVVVFSVFGPISSLSQIGAG